MSVSAPALQSVFPAMPKRFAPMLDANGVRALISEHFEYTADDLFGDVECGKFEWVFDVSADASGRRRELRFYKPSVEQYLRKLLNPKWVVRSNRFDDVLRDLFPHRNPRKAWVTTPEVVLALVCDHLLVLDLVRAKALRICGENAISAGRGNATRIEWASVGEFLEGRRL